MAFTYSKLAETTVGAGGVSTITFNNIPQNYTDLKVVLSVRTNRGAVADTLNITFNGSSSYSIKTLFGNTGAGTVNSYSDTKLEAVWTTAASNTANSFANSEVYIPNYTSSSNKSISADSVTETNNADAYQAIVAGLWSNATAINSITFTSNTASTIVQYSTATLYGIRVEL